MRFPGIVVNDKSMQAHCYQETNRLGNPRRGSRANKVGGYTGLVDLKKECAVDDAAEADEGRG